MKMLTLAYIWSSFQSEIIVLSFTVTTISSFPLISLFSILVGDGIFVVVVRHPLTTVHCAVFVKFCQVWTRIVESFPTMHDERLWLCFHSLPDTVCFGILVQVLGSIHTKRQVMRENDISRFCGLHIKSMILFTPNGKRQLSHYNGFRTHFRVPTFPQSQNSRIFPGFFKEFDAIFQVYFCIGS